MADDFGFFSSSESGAAEAADEDPAAAFLAQQENEIAGIENDEGISCAEGAGRGSQEAAGEPRANFENTGGATVNGDVFQLEVVKMVRAITTVDTNGSFKTQLKSTPGSAQKFQELTWSPDMKIMLAVNGKESNGPTDAYAAIARADRLTQEPESIRKWREEQKKRLQELDAASKVLEQEWREKAKKDLEEWNIRQNEQMERNQANNRIADKAFYQQPDADVIGYVASEEAFLKESKEETAGTEWEKVAQLCDFNPKSSKQSKDVSRMRSVLISLKQIPLAR